MKFQPIIGLEIHIQLNTVSKMFCGCDANIWPSYAKASEGKQAEPNTHTCPVCLGLPGALSVINKIAVEKAILAGLAFNCKVNKFTKWDRKNYFYPDLPKGYQISQYDLPLAENGWLELENVAAGASPAHSQARQGRAATIGVAAGASPAHSQARQGRAATIGIRRTHLEEDTAKSIHRSGATLLDFNKSGIPLLEIVTEPDIHSSDEAVEFGKKVREILRATGVTEGNMEKGQLRLELNISIQQSTTCNKQLPPYKVEVKNINSFRFLGLAIEYEIKRQTKLLEKNETPIQETRGFDETKNITFVQRVKEEAQDYRYFPEPDLPPLRFTDADIEKIKAKIPKLPQIFIQEIIAKFGITQKQAQILAKKKVALDYAITLVQKGMEPQRAANIVINRPEVLKMKPKEFLEKLRQEEKSRVGDGEELSVIIQKVLRDNPNAVRDFQSGKKETLKFLVGQVMHETLGRADPKTAREILENLLQ